MLQVEEEGDENMESEIPEKIVHHQITEEQAQQFVLKINENWHLQTCLKSQSGNKQSYDTDSSEYTSEPEQKLRSKFARYKKWDDADRCKVEKLDGNKVLVNDQFIIDVDHTYYIHEKDVTIEFEDEDWRDMPPLPKNPNSKCEAPSCLLGCICESLTQKPIQKSHCAKFTCCLGCTCQPSSENLPRLRPRASLLNWRHIEDVEGEKNLPPPANYRQLDRGANFFVSRRRPSVLPQRFREEFVMSADHNPKHLVATTTAHDREAKFTPPKAQKQPATANKLKRKAQSKEKEKTPEKEAIPDKKCQQYKTMDHKLVSEENSTDNKHEDTDKNKIKIQLPVQTHLEVPLLIQAMTEDVQLILIGREQMCFLSWTLHSNQPKVVIYNPIKGDIMPIPWLYLPISSFGEIWIFHTISESLNVSTHTSIPEINCLLPSDTLRMQLNLAQAKKKGIALKMLWVGKDAKQRSGTIYIFPQLPNVLICGPFPKTLIKSSYSSNRVLNPINVNAFLNKISKKPPMGYWNIFNTARSVEAYNQVKRNVEQEMQEVDSDSSGEDISEEEFMKMVPGFIAPEDYIHTPFGQYVQTLQTKTISQQSQDNLKVTWNDAAQMFSNGSNIFLGEMQTNTRK